MRFDDSLTTVLASDATTGFGAQAAWRQLVDLLGRGRTPPTPTTIGQLRSLRGDVPIAIRAASARALAFAHPPAALIAVFAEDELAIAAPVLRTAMLKGEEWLALLPALSSPARSVLRHRRDLPSEVMRGLESFGRVDFVLGHDDAAAAPSAVVTLADDPPPILDVVAPPSAPPAPPAAPPSLAPAAPNDNEPRGRFEIADLVARIDAFQRDRSAPAISSPAADHAETFAFETDAGGTIRWIDGAPRAALIGLSLAHPTTQGLARVDGSAATAVSDRTPLADLGLTLAGTSPAAGDWRLAAIPVYATANGRFVGYRGQARRARADEVAAAQGGDRAASETLRQLVHELRTPTNAIAGFAELIETQLLGPVPPSYREQAGTIRRQVTALLGAIDDLDTAARLAGQALELRTADIALEPIIARALADLAPLATLRGVTLAFDPAAPHHVHADEPAAERLIGRLLAAVIAVASSSEKLRVKVKTKGDGSIAVQIDRPAALIDDDGVDDGAGAGDRGAAPLLGVAFTLRLARNLAAALGGSLIVGDDRLTLRFPAALDRTVGHAAHR